MDDQKRTIPTSLAHKKAALISPTHPMEYQLLNHLLMLQRFQRQINQIGQLLQPASPLKLHQLPPGTPSSNLCVSALMNQRLQL